MGLSFFLENTLKSLKCLTSYLIIIILLTVIVTVVISVLSKNLWVDKKKFAWLGLFYGMDLRSVLSLASVWMLIILSIFFAIDRNDVRTVEYVFYLVPAIIYLIVGRPRKRIFVRLLFMFLLFAGVFATDLISGYMSSTFNSIFLMYIYICLTVIIVFFTIYIFLVELNNISQNRKPFDEMEIEKNE